MNSSSPRSVLLCSLVECDRRTDRNCNLRVCTLRFCFCFLLTVFSFRCVPMDPLVRPEFLLLLLEQGDRSLEDYTRLFLLLANTTSYPDDALCSFYDASLNTASRALSPEDGPREEFAAFVTHSRPSAQPTISPLRGAHA